MPMMKKQRVTANIFFSVLFWLSAFAANAQEHHQFLELQESDRSFKMGAHMQFFIDTLANHDITSVVSEQGFIDSDRDIPNYNSGDNPIWYRCNIINRSQSRRFIVNVTNPAIDEVEFYYPDSANRYTKINYGSNRPFNQRKYLDANYLFDLNIAPDDTVMVYFRLLSADISRFPVSIGTTEVIFSELKTKDLIISIYIGVMLVMLLYNLFIYFTVRDNSYLYYVVYILTILLTQVGVFGTTFQYLWPDYPWIEELSLLIFPPLTGVTGMAFMHHFLQTKEYLPRFRKISYVLNALYCVSFALIFMGKYRESFQLTQMVAMLVALFMLATAYMIQRKGLRPARFFLIAWSIFLIGIVIFVLSDTGAIPYSNFTVYTMPVGSALEVILLSFALADKINVYRTETAAAQLEALMRAEENERIIKEQNVILEGKVAERTSELKQSNEELSKTLNDLKETQSQLVESEKMASLGQLTAGIAHEINNPINFVTSNVKPLKRDVDLLLNIITQIEDVATKEIAPAEKQTLINDLKTEHDFDYLKEEIEFLLKGINEGSSRTAEIVKGLRIFSRVDEDDLKRADINEGLDSTITIINNQLNGRIRIIREYGNLPLVECFPGKLNQVFLNLLSNSIYAIRDKFGDAAGGEITLSTRATDNSVLIGVKDNGVGMTEATQKKLFEPFFTTKPVGEGTGLGLSISYNTVKKHNGTINVKSVVNEGTEFIIDIPIIQINA
jgi:signal transduction histidine kinase